MELILVKPYTSYIKNFDVPSSSSPTISIAVYASTASLWTKSFPIKFHFEYRN
jgi:hypothetical protein